MAWRFEPQEPLAEAFLRVATDEIAKVRNALSNSAGDGAKAIHDSRQCFKRLRALLRLAQPSLGKSFRKENRFWRDAARQLSGARDRKVLMDTFDRVAADCRKKIPARRLRSLRSAVMGDGPAGDGTEADAAIAGVLATLDAAEQRTRALKWPDDPKALAKGIKHGQRRLRKDWKSAWESGDSADLHELRKRVKDQAAHLRLLRRLVPPAMRERHDAEKRTAALLGDEHDLWMLAERLSAVELPDDANADREALLGVIAERRDALRGEAFALGRSFATDEPKALARELVGLWQAAHARAQREAAGMPAAAAEKDATSPAS